MSLYQYRKMTKEEIIKAYKKCFGEKINEKILRILLNFEDDLEAAFRCGYRQGYEFAISKNDCKFKKHSY